MTRQTIDFHLVRTSQNSLNGKSFENTEQTNMHLF
ncbi:hypothetical protein WN55_04209 [Dufourea novaeangliae]|uniref:Uncharacterized protein n=1 Tax=Dufourea novaeangliae TaxID=178035 RepID=A0A154NVY7_DUFNO|nr:hypothetical protein WN55_04209 [Dufourea novaeangliae]